MKSPENHSMEQQVEKFEKERQSEEEQALNLLLDELKEKPRALTAVENIFLKRQLDRIDTALRRPHEDGVEQDDLNIKSGTISKLLKKE